MRRRFASTLSFAALCLAATAVTAQTTAIQPGEAYLTRFSGAVAGPAGPTIDASGTVGSIVDVRRPGRPPQGEHWVDEPQRQPVSAAEIGQVFGVALDGTTGPDVFLAATSAFGLHLKPGSAEWMDGMWGMGGGPGSIWRLVAADGYRPRLFAQVGVGGRANTGAGLGNLAYDKVGRQLFVSDMETGLIHRIDATSGADLGTFDHGTTGRGRFVDAASGQAANLPPIAFDPASRARIGDCAAGPFATTPACWNLAASGRQVWGVAVRTEPGTTGRRLYYGVWSGPSDGNAAWAQASDEDKRTAVWSVGLTPDGGFDTADVRREFLVPDFFVEPKDIAAAGFSRPVSDITFDDCASRPVMIVSERGGHRNLGLGKDNAFAFPHESRVLRYEMDQAGKWQPVGRYDVGYRDRRDDGKPYLRANASGGAAFGYGYTADFSSIDRNAPGEFLWMTGDSLCSPDAPCRAPGGAQGAATNAAATENAGDGSEVHGLQGTAEIAFDALVPKGAWDAYPEKGEPYPAIGPDQSWMIDADIDVRPDGTAIDEEFTRNDATHIGDVAIPVTCNAPAPTTAAELLPVMPAAPIGRVVEVEGHDRVLTHAVVASHGATSSHFRIASHNPWWSHDAFRSHNRWRSHDVVASRPIHRPIGSWHRPIGSVHRPIGSLHHPWGSIHRPIGSIHRPIGSWHRPQGSVHVPRGSIHRPIGSLHRPPGSVHQPFGSIHRPIGSVHMPRGSVHMPKGSIHVPKGSVHLPAGSVHRPPGSVHLPRGSVHQPPGSVHRPVGSVHRPPGSIKIPSGTVRHPPTKVHQPAASNRPVPVKPKSQVQPRRHSVQQTPLVRRSGQSVRTQQSVRPSSSNRSDRLIRKPPQQ